MRNLVLSLFAVSAASSVAFALTCEDVFQQTTVVRIQSQFAENRSFATFPIATSPLKFNLSYADALFDSIIRNQQKIFEREQQVSTTNLKGAGIINDLNSLEPKHRARLRRLIREINKIVKATHPALRAGLKRTGAQVRWASGDVRGMIVETWHQDGEPLDVIVILKGQGTEVFVPVNGAVHARPDRDSPVTFAVSEGHALLFTGLQSAAFGYRPTIHRTPPITRDRLILVLRYRR